MLETATTPLIILNKIAKLDIISGSFDAVLVAPEVANELKTLNVEGLVVKAVEDSGLVRALASQMDLREAATVALAYETPNSVAVLDDRKGRRVAREMGLSVVGTLGTVVRAKELGIIEEAAPIFSLIQKAGLFVSPSLVQEALRRAGES